MSQGKNLFYSLICVAVLVLSLSANAQQTATATASVDGISVVGINVTFGGSGYTFPPAVTISGGGGTGAAAYSTISNGVVTAITVTDAGTAYSSPPIVNIQSPSTTPFASSLVLDLEVTNGTFADMGPYQLPLTTNNGCSFVPDRFGFNAGAVALNGTSQSLQIPFTNVLYPAEMTLSAWVEFNNFNTGDGSTIFRAGNASTDNWRGYFFGVSIDSQALPKYFDFTGSGYNVILNPATNIVTHRWYQFAVTRTTNACSFFINGIKIGSQTSLTPYTQPLLEPLLIGASYNFNETPFIAYLAGALDALHIYNRALSDTEVQSLYAIESVNSNAPPQLGIAIKAIRVSISQLISNDVYQLQQTMDFNTWTNVGSSFTATNSTAYEDVDIINTGQGFFRLVKIP